MTSHRLRASSAFPQTCATAHDMHTQVSVFAPWLSCRFTVSGNAWKQRGRKAMIKRLSTASDSDLKPR